MDYFLDTNFLVGLWRQPKHGPEVDFLARHPDQVMGLSWMAKGEFLRGAVVAGHAAESVERFLSTLPVAWPSESTLIRYARVFADLRVKRQMIGPNDLWIAASALEHGLPLVTRNIEEFRRVEGLVVVDYVAMLNSVGGEG